MRRILVLVDSMRALDRFESRAASPTDGSTVFHDPSLQVHERGDAAAASPVDPGVECLFAGLTVELEHQS